MTHALPFFKASQLETNIDSQTRINWQGQYQREFQKNFFNYEENDLSQILNKEGNIGKLEPNTLPEGSWKITQNHTNVTATLLRNNYIEQIIIRGIKPFFNEESTSSSWWGRMA